MAYYVAMIHKTDLDQLEQRALDARVTMSFVCKQAGMFRQSWHRAKKRGRMEMVPFLKLRDAVEAIEAERASS